MSDSVNQPRTFEVLTAAPVRALRKPRDWPNEEKERLTAETLLPGANVSAIARAEGLDPSQLYGWRRKALSSGLIAPLAEAAAKEVKFAKHVCRRGCERSGWLRLPCSSPDEAGQFPGDRCADHRCLPALSAQHSIACRQPALRLPDLGPLAMLVPDGRAFSCPLRSRRCSTRAGHYFRS